MINLLLRTAKFSCIFLLLINILAGLSVPVNIYLVQNLIDGVVNTAQHSPYYYLVFILLVNFGVVVVNKTAKLLKINLSNKVEIHFGELLFGKCSAMQYEYFEKSSSYPVIDRVVNGYRDNIVGLIDMVTSILRITVSVVGVFYYLFIVDWRIFLALFITAIPVWALSVISAMKEQDTFKQVYPFLLKSRYLSGVISSREYAKETRLYNSYSHIEKVWEENVSKFNRGQILSNLKPRFTAGLFIILQYLVITGIIFLLLLPLHIGAITIGVIIAIAQAMWNFAGGFQYELIDIIYAVSRFRVFANDYHTLLSYKDGPVHSGVAEKTSFEKIVFDDVWYCYGDEGDFVLKGINLVISNRELIALVGENGSGKTTLIKLLLGLLTPVRGAIYVDDVPLSDISPAGRKKIMSAVFQDFVKYNISLRENIGIADLDRMDDEKRMLDILDRLNNRAAILSNLGSGIDTRLGKEIDGGTDLSGGQWQTIAIARALFADSACMILDEPTASLDPLAEVDVYNQLIGAARDRTAIFVTHRLGSTTLADTIYTLDKGQIVERGSHEQLMKEGGKYAEMFNAQKKWYTR